MNPRSPDDIVTELEFTLDMPRVVLLVALAILLLAAAFTLGRTTASPAVVQERANGSGFSPVEDSAALSVFDRGDSESLARGAWDLDLGTVSDRSAAETRRGIALKAGVPAVVVRNPDGGFRIAAGPYETEGAARAAADKLVALPAGSVRVVPRSR